MRVYKREVDRGEVVAAGYAVQKLGGATAAARRIAEATGRRCTPDMVVGWCRYGVGARWVPAVSKITGVPPEDLNKAFRVEDVA